MKATIGFIFFMLFLAGIALVNLRGMKDRGDAAVTSASQLTGITWRPVAIGEMRLADDNGMYLEFDADGKVHGNAGCNRFFGEYTLNQGKLIFGPLGATRMACPEPANSFELSFLDALATVVGASRVEQRLALHNEQGHAVTRFVATIGNETNQ